MPVHFIASSCAVSPQGHPYPWEPHLTTKPSRLVEWSDDFTDIHSGWPSRPDDHLFDRAAFGYVPHGYEITFHHAPRQITALKGDVVAQGPVWGDFRASVLVESDWSMPRPDRDLAQTELKRGVYRIAAGMVFHMGPEGYYAFLLTGAPTPPTKLKSSENQHLRFTLQRRTWTGKQTEIIRWTDVPPPEAFFSVLPPATLRVHKISVEDEGGVIALFVDDREVGLQEKDSTLIRRMRDSTYSEGLTGFAVFGDGRALYHDLIVDGPQ